jgi:DNA-binding winged helix-turn-helix (wHTH) protein
VAENTFYQNISILRKSLRLVGLTDDIIVTIRRKGFSLAEGIIIERREETYEQPEVLEIENHQISNKTNTICMKKTMRSIMSNNVTNFEYWLLLIMLFLLLFIELVSLGISFFA